MQSGAELQNRNAVKADETQAQADRGTREEDLGLYSKAKTKSRLTSRVWPYGAASCESLPATQLGMFEEE